LPKLSIVTINFNDVKGLSETIQSVIVQTFRDFEYIVIDGGSTDGSAKVIEDFREHISYSVTEPDRGIYHAMNKGLEKAKGEYILFLNSGDTLYSAQTLEKVFPLLTDYDIVYGDSLDVNFSDGRSDLLRKYPNKLTFLFFFQSALRHQATFIKKSLYEKIGSYDESYKIVSDWILMIRAFTEFKASSRHIDLPVCRYKRGGISSSNLSLNDQERERFLKTNFPFFYDDYVRLRSVPATDADAWGGGPMKNVKLILKYILPFGLVRFIRRTRNHR
jgi:glycosyltransferase involved in cell wall biosynthesis